MTLTPFTIELGIVVLLLVGIIAFLIRLEIRLNRVLRGKRGKDLEESLGSLIHDMETSIARSEAFERQMQNVNDRLRHSIQAVHTVRFNPFRDQGGNQSFATAFLDEEGNGVVLSGLHSRDKVHVYAKPLLSRASTYELSDEEREAIENASL